jgi:FeS assembly protein SufD
MAELKQAKSKIADEIKKEALPTFNSLSMPKEKDEDFRYTDIEKLKLESLTFKDAKIKVSDLCDEAAEKGFLLTDINTALEKFPYAKDYLFKGIKLDKFLALNKANFTNGYFIYAGQNAVVDEPIKISYEITDNTAMHNLVIAEPGSFVEIIEEYSAKSDKESVNCCVTELFSNENAQINFSHVNSLSSAVNNFSQIIGTTQKNARINFISGCFGGKLNRVKIDTYLNGEGSNCTNLGVFLGRNKEHMDVSTNVYHNAENTVNDIVVDGILKDESSSVYRGLIRIPKSGQKTNSYLQNHVLKLGDKTLANSIPSLKIDANDVKASHGATVGQIAEEQLFYLMSRGLSRDGAIKMIVDGFFEPVIKKIPNKELRETIRGMVGK